MKLDPALFARGDFNKDLKLAIYILIGYSIFLLLVGMMVGIIIFGDP